MKKLYILLFTILISGLSFGQTTLAQDDFSYADGPLVGNGSWTTNGGNAGTLLVAGGQAIISQDSGSEDAELIFDNDLTSGIVSATFDINVTASGAMTGNDFEYFAHFSDDSDTNFRARVDVIAPTAAGDYTLGFSGSSSTNDTSLTVDFSFGSTVSVEITYNLNDDTASLTAGGQTVTSAGVADQTLDTFNIRQSNSSSDETISLDNLVITYDSTLDLKDFNSLEVKLYPNPSNTGEVTITSANSADISVSVFDVLGKQFKNETFSNNKLNVSNLRSGIYILRITQGNAETTKKLVIQ
ncbi:T9SS type A sorting domain-containing protein [Algibacter sp.]|nr:T9SS type A sorting domain-containing protein [Algibacter sp.]